jgi:Spy/CpxP family protein refolding chaperone
MTRNKTHAFVFASALALSAAFLAVSARSAQSPASQSQRTIKSRFEVVQMSYQSIQVRSLDLREHFTFTYSPEIRDQMQNIFNAGGYQYGDKIVVWHKSGDEVALKIKGKPSKPN